MGTLPTNKPGNCKCHDFFQFPGQNLGELVLNCHEGDVKILHFWPRLPCDVSNCSPEMPLWIKAVLVSSAVHVWVCVFLYFGLCWSLAPTASSNGQVSIIPMATTATASFAPPPLLDRNGLITAYRVVLAVLSVNGEDAAVAERTVDLPVRHCRLLFVVIESSSIKWQLDVFKFIYKMRLHDDL